LDKLRYKYCPINLRKKLILPNNAKIAVWVGINIEYFDINLVEFGGIQSFKVEPPNVFDYSVRDYGNRIGIWRVSEILQKYGVKASVLLNSDVCDHYPEIIEHGKKLEWEFLGHGNSNSVLLNGLSEQQEKKIIRSCVDTITESTGQQPRGWLSPALQETFATLDLLSEEGISYVCDWCCDDQPFNMKVENGKMISIPYSVEINDYKLFLIQNFSPEDYFQILKENFDTLYKEGSINPRVMCIGLHPFIIGQPFRIKEFDRILKYIENHDDVWLTTSGDIANWFEQENNKR